MSPDNSFPEIAFIVLAYLRLCNNLGPKFGGWVVASGGEGRRRRSGQLDLVDCCRRWCTTQLLTAASRHSAARRMTSKFQLQYYCSRCTIADDERQADICRLTVYLGRFWTRKPTPPMHFAGKGKKVCAGHCTMGKLQWGDGNRNFSLLREILTILRINVTF